jgi:thiol-disulfide isomerase/thioredoxin
MEDGIKDDEKTIKSKKDVESLLKSKEPVAILFFMRSCGHCIATKPVWDEIANDGSMDMRNASSDNVPDSLDITGFPTMIVVKDGKVSKRIDGSRTDTKELKKELTGGRRRVHSKRRLNTRRLRRRSVRKARK